MQELNPHHHLLCITINEIDVMYKFYTCMYIIYGCVYLPLNREITDSIVDINVKCKNFMIAGNTAGQMMLSKGEHVTP